MPAATSLADLRAHALDPSRARAEPTMAKLPSIANKGTSLILAVSREDARDYFDCQLFTGGLAVVSVSSNATANGYELAEFLAWVHRALGEDVPAKLRHLPLPGARADYYGVLVDGDSFHAPSPLQDAWLATHHGASPVLPRPHPGAGS